MEYRNAAHAVVAELGSALQSGDQVEVRGRITRELRARVVTLARPSERCITVPARRNDIFAAIAETMWVIGGRNDLEYLTHYLPRAPQFSDDGRTWRAAYGPRIRNWAGVDQVREVVRLLRADPSSRRAVISLYDPAKDFVDSRDIPCNNWLHFTVRDGALDMNVAVRSNDLVWGFSGINTFEWSVLLEMIAHWLGVEVGRATYFVSSLHVYAEHYARAREISTRFTGESGYEAGWVETKFETSLDNFDETLSEWFALEEAIRAGAPIHERVAAFPDPLLRQFLQMILIRKTAASGAAEEDLESLIGELGHSDLAYAARERLFRAVSGRVDSGLEADARDSRVSGAGAVRDAIRTLHRVKSASYGSSWKRRGEQISVMANIARKVDRLEVFREAGSSAAESVVDTAVDLYVYSLKYLTFLADEYPELTLGVFDVGEAGPFSEGVGGFERLLEAEDLHYDGLEDLDGALVSAIRAFADLEGTFRDAVLPTLPARLVRAKELRDRSREVLLACVALDPAGSVRQILSASGE